MSGMLPFTTAPSSPTCQLGTAAVWDVAFPCPSWGCVKLLGAWQKTYDCKLSANILMRNGALLGCASCAGPAIIQVSGVQSPPPASEGRASRKARVQPLTAELLNRLPSFYLASTSKACPHLVLHKVVNMQRLCPFVLPNSDCSC